MKNGFLKIYQSGVISIGNTVLNEVSHFDLTDNSLIIH